MWYLCYLIMYICIYISLYLKYIKVLIFCIFFEKIDKEIYFNLINKYVFNKYNINKLVKLNYLNYVFIFLVEL